MENIYLKDLAKKGIFSVTDPQFRDKDAPFSFIEWKQQRLNYPEQDIYFYYQQYLIDWFEFNKQKPVNQTFVLRQKYLYLLQQLQTFFTEEEKQSWYNKINLSDEKELSIAIPFFAQKLKTICLYYLHSRKKLKNLKIQYNHIGTVAGLEKELTTFLLENYTSLNEEILPSIKTKLPEFDGIKNTFQIKIEELYDDFNYSDKSNSLPLSSSYDLFNQATIKLFETKGLTLSSDSWIFNSLNALSLEEYEAYVDQLTGNIFETTDVDTYQILLENLISENQISTTFTQTNSATEVFGISLLSGNNAFFYPYGKSYENESVNEATTIFLPVALSSLSIEGSTAGTSLSAADVLFIRNGNSLKGAWLKYIDFTEENQTVIAKIKENANTKFIFPFAGYGLSAENVNWTGYSLSATNEYEFLSKPIRQLIDETYWTSDLPADQCDDVYINSSTLAENGAVANKNPNFADQILKYNDKPDARSLPLDLNSGAWLYQFNKTSIPITYFSSTFPLLWPYQYIKEIDSTTGEDIVPAQLPDYLTKINYENVCNPTSVSSLNVPFAIPSTDINSAEKIYKLKSFTDDVNDATECCWLSGRMVAGDQNSWIEQEGFSGLFQPGVPTRFVWTGANNTPLSSVFSSINHAADCQVVVNKLINQPENCNCKQVFYSPHGHSGDVFYFNSAAADFIVAYTAQPDENFDIQNALRNTNKFAWYKTKSSYPDWGNGNWVYGLEGNSFPFYLETGKSYVYSRAADKQNKAYPPYVVNYKFNTVSHKPKWIQAKKNADGEWISSDTAAETVLYAGDLIKWSKPENVKTFYLSSYNVANESVPLSSIWSSNQIVAVGNGLQNSTFISWPLTIIETNIYDPQIPQTQDGGIITFDKIQNVLSWVFTHVETGSSFEIRNQSSFTFTPPSTGTYNIQVQANVRIEIPSTETTRISTTVSGTTVVATVSSVLPTLSTETITFTGIPPIYAVSQFRTEYVAVTSERPTSGYMLEQPLYGWNYNTNTMDKAAFGARPYWAELYLDKVESTKYKGLLSWGYPEEYFSGYLPNFTPKISQLTLQYGNTVDYSHKGIGFSWKQPLVYKKFVNETLWCQLTSDITGPSSLSAFYEIKNDNDPVVFSTSDPSDIQLTNFINGYPVEIFYYATNAFVWSISATSLVTNSQSITSIYLESYNPYFANRFYPTIATIPIPQNVYSIDESGGYFAPQHLGASQYINQNFTPYISSGQYFNTTAITQNPNKIVGGKGLSNTDHTSIYSWTENNQWLKEPFTSNLLAGSTRKSLTKNYQTFVPYKNAFTEKPTGMLNSSSKLTPWGGPTSEVWVDLNNEPKSYTGVYNVSAWKSSQFLKNTNYNMEGWVTDIYGNQFGLFKPTETSSSLLARSKQGGQLWVRTNNGSVQPASIALSSVVQFYENDVEFNNVYEDLNGTGVIEVDCFYDTLMVQTSGAVIFSKIVYDFEKNEIKSSYDTIRNIKINSNQLVGQSWFVSNLKKIITPFVTLSSECPFIELYELNLPVFTNLSINSTTLNNTIFQNLSSFKIGAVTNCTTSYDSTLKHLLVTTSCKDLSGHPFLFDCVFDVNNDYELIDITTYSSDVAPKLPSVSSYSNNLLLNLGTDVNLQLQFEGAPLSAQLLNYSDSLTLTPAGVLSGTLPNLGLHFINYSLANAAGSNTFGMAISCTPFITELPVVYVDKASPDEYYIEDPYAFIVSEIDDPNYVICLKTIGKFEVFNGALSSEGFIRLAWDSYIFCNKTQLNVGETATLSSISNDLYTFYYLNTGTNNTAIAALVYGDSNQTSVLTSTDTYNQLIN